MEKALIAFLCLIPTLYEAWSDRKGEDRKGKRKDFIWLSLVALALAGYAWWAGYAPLSVIGLILGFRVLIFDYLVQYLLIKNKVIVGHWFTYNGKTSWFDKLAAKIHPVIRLILRLIVFALAVWWYTF